MDPISSREWQFLDEEASILLGTVLNKRRVCAPPEGGTGVAVADARRSPGDA